MAKKYKIPVKRAPFIFSRFHKIAAPPGTIAPHEGAIEPSFHVITYGPDNIEEQDVKTVSDLKVLRGKTPVLWVNINGVGNAETFKELGQIFCLHPLALEDVVNLSQRPKAEDYDDHAYIVLQMPYGKDTLSLEQVSMFIGPDYVITVQERPGDCLDPLRQRLQKKQSRIRKSGSDYLAYAVIDAIIDNYFPIVERFNERLEVIEEKILRHQDEDTVNEIHSIRHDLHSLRRSLSPTKEAVNVLSRGETGPVTETTMPFLRDCQDHASQLIDAIEACRELSSGLMDLNLSSLSNRMNEIMKVLTLIATIFIPLGFIAGIYGMNFDSSISPFNMPELGLYFGYPMAIGLMLVIAVGFLIYFRYRGWLGKAQNGRKKRG